VADTDAARADFEVDVWSPLALIGAFVPGMRQRRDGTVVNVTSVRQVITWPSFGQNSGAQSALAQITETLRLELLADDVHVIEVIPGPAETAMQGPTRLLPGITEAFHDRLGVATPQEVAEAIVEAIELGADRVFCPESGRRLYEDPTAARAQIADDVRRMAAQQDRNPEIDTFVVEADHPLILAARAQWEGAHDSAT
jgi:short-subunit dehydrogenase